MYDFRFQVSDEAGRVGRPTDVEVLLAPSLRNSARRDSFTCDVRGGIGGAPGTNIASEIFRKFAEGRGYQICNAFAYFTYEQLAQLPNRADRPTTL